MEHVVSEGNWSRQQFIWWCVEIGSLLDIWYYYYYTCFLKSFRKINENFEHLIVLSISYVVHSGTTLLYEIIVFVCSAIWRRDVMHSKQFAAKSFWLLLLSPIYQKIDFKLKLEKALIFRRWRRTVRTVLHSSGVVRRETKKSVSEDIHTQLFFLVYFLSLRIFMPTNFLMQMSFSPRP